MKSRNIQSFREFKENLNISDFPTLVVLTVCGELENDGVPTSTDEKGFIFKYMEIYL